MTKNTETGYAVSIANFNELVQHCQSFGTSYNPAIAELRLADLQRYASNAEAQLTTVHAANAAHKDNIAQRAALYKDLNALTTRLRNAVQVYDILPQIQQQVVTFTKKLQGISSRKKATAESPDPDATTVATEPKTISTYQTSFEQRVNTLDKIVQTLANQPQYQPNEPDLQVTSLAALVQDIRTLNIRTAASEITQKTALVTLQNLLHNDDTSLRKLTAKVKLYTKSVFGSQSTECARLRKIAV